MWRKILFERSTELGDSIIMSIENLIRPQGHVTPKWLIWSGRNSNSFEILCPSWLPASLTKIRSKMNELAWRHHFPIISLWEIFQTLKAPNSVGSGPIWPKFNLDFMPVLVTCKFEKKSDKKQKRKGVDIVFPIISQWVLSVAMETRVLIQSVPKPYATFPPP